MTFDLAAGDVFVFCSDGVSEANDSERREFGSERLMDVVAESEGKTAAELVDDVFAAVQRFRGDAQPNDDMTAVAIRITS